MVSVGERSGGGELIAILGAGSLGRLWAALLPSGYCGFCLASLMICLSMNLGLGELQPSGGGSQNTL